MKIIEDIAYGTEREQLLDLFLPDAAEFPVFVYFHGGGIESGSRKSMAVFAEQIVASGIALVSADYRMYPDAKYPDFICDAAKATAWVKDNIGRYGKSKGIFVGGSSAGGYLSMMLCFDEKYLANEGVAPTDIAGYFHDAGQPTVHFNVLRECGVDSRRVIIDERAPLFYIGKSNWYPPMHFVVSDNDMANRYEQTMLVLSTLKHFGLSETVSHTVMHGTHCLYCNEKKGAKNEKGEHLFIVMIRDFILKHI